MIRFLILLLLVVLAAACGGDDDVGWEGTLVGGPCEGDEDCDGECARGDDFPDGTCTVFCDGDEDCPAGTSCIDREDGICLLACELPDDCPRGYGCEGVENRGHGGDSLVCIGD